jgi:streptogramin lyase
MNVHARARASAQAIDRSATRVDPVAGLDDLLRRRRRQPLQWAAVALAALVVAVAIWAGAVVGGPTPVSPTLGPVTGFRAGPSPVSVAITPGAAWVLNSGNSTISRLDPDTGRIETTFSVQLPEKRVGPSRFATVADGRLWVVSAVDDDAPKSAISAIDPSTGHTLTRFELGGSVFQDQVTRGDVAIGSGTVWVALQGEDEIRRIDAATGTLLDQIPLPGPTALAVDGKVLWAATADGRLYRVVPGTGATRVRATTGMVTRIRVGQGGVWLMTFDGKVLRLDPRTGRIAAQVPGTFQAADLAVGAEGVWVYDQRRGAVLQIDPATNRVARAISVIRQPLVELDSRVLAVGDGAVWVVDKGAGTLIRVAT